MAEPAYPLVLPEAASGRPFPAQGEWTYEDYCRLPDDGRRYEVIRGYLYVSAAPSVEHQRTVQRLNWKLNSFVLQHDLGEVLTAPLDILLPREIASPVQPDIVFFRKGNQAPFGAPNVRGVPDLVVEVLSPSTRRLDIQIKFAAFQDAGAPEVWFADWEGREVVVHTLSEDGTRYVELCRSGEGDSVFSKVLSGLRVAVSEIFPPCE